jgi:hypothetical protein
MFRRNIPPPSSVSKNKPSKKSAGKPTSADFQRNTRRFIPEDSSLQISVKVPNVYSENPFYQKAVLECLDTLPGVRNGETNGFTSATFSRRNVKNDL